MVTTVGVFGLVFLFNITMLGVTIRRVVGLRQTKEVRVNLHSLHSALLVFKNDLQRIGLVIFFIFLAVKIHHETNNALILLTNIVCYTKTDVIYSSVIVQKLLKTNH